MDGKAKTRERFRKARRNIQGENTDPPESENDGSAQCGPENCSVGLGITPGEEMGIAWTDGDRVVTGVSSFWDLWSALASLNPSAALSSDVEELRDEGSCCVVVRLVSSPRQHSGEACKELEIAYSLGKRRREGEMLARWLKDAGYLTIEDETTAEPPCLGRDQDKDENGEWQGPHTAEIQSAVNLLRKYELA